MRHAKGLRNLGRSSSHRRALLRNMATTFIKQERFETTVEKAKELRPIVERLITTGKTDTLAARRQAYSYLLDKAVVHKLFTDVGPRCASRNGGYTRIVRTRYRNGDAAQLAVIELVDRAGQAAPAKKAEKSEAAKAPKKAAAKKPAAEKKATEKKPTEKKASTKKAAEKKA
jgi:large subunit ribosomal protein L17